MRFLTTESCSATRQATRKYLVQPLYAHTKLSLGSQTHNIYYPGKSPLAMLHLVTHS
jgi:hypothetical protein